MELLTNSRPSALLSLIWKDSSFVRSQHFMTCPILVTFLSCGHIPTFTLTGWPKKQRSHCAWHVWLTRSCVDTLDALYMSTVTSCEMRSVAGRDALCDVDAGFSLVQSNSTLSGSWPGGVTGYSRERCRGSTLLDSSLWWVSIGRWIALRCSHWNSRWRWHHRGCRTSPRALSCNKTSRLCSGTTPLFVQPKPVNSRQIWSDGTMIVPESRLVHSRSSTVARPSPSMSNVLYMVVLEEGEAEAKNR